MTADININTEQDRFFIAICKRGVHSFLMLGIYDQYRVGHLLCRVGKWSNRDVVLGCCLFEANIVDEGISSENKGDKSISYQAYDISYDHYLEFIRILEALETKKVIHTCYKPKSRNGSKVTLAYTNRLKFPLSTGDEKVDELKTQCSQHSINNTCRHAAIRLIEAIQPGLTSPEVSSYFFRDLPYQTNLEYGKPSAAIPFYVLPIPPVAYPDLMDKKRQVVEKLYRRMEKMLFLDPDSQKTQDKFNILKDLYNNILGPQKELTIDQLLGSIHTWKDTNKSILNELRETYFWDYFITRQSATMSCIEEIEQDLQLKSPS